MLNVEAVNQYYGGSHILRGLDFEAKVGEVTVILGRNGVGKTTLLKSLMGLVPIKSGAIKLDGQVIDQLKPYERVRRGVGYVPQGREIFGRLTVAENLEMGLASQPGSTPLPPQLFELFPVLKQMLHRRGGDLSGGQQQQLAIARALAAGPKLLILDEPTEGIQPSIIKDIGRAIRKLADEGLNGQRWPWCWSSSSTTLPPSWPTSTWSWSVARSSSGAGGPRWKRTACANSCRSEWFRVVGLTGECRAR